MASREPTRHQLSSRLQYDSHVPTFLQKFHNKIKGITTEDDDEPEYYDDGSGRPPIPVRPAIPERPSDDPGSASEDDEDEKPQVVVLKAGKHLTAREAENERRKEKGLPPLPVSDDQSTKQDDKKPNDATKSKQPAPSLSFSSSSTRSSTSSNKLKRRIVTERDDSGNEGDKVKDKGDKVKRAPKKKSKREGKSLLSFGEDV
ncbi:protein of unknown function (DUF4604) domain containing protein [Tylopilus felleus]